MFSFGTGEIQGLRPTGMLWKGGLVPQFSS